jgi:hypothetical protein
MIRLTHLPVHCAPLERQTILSREVYKHLAPPEPEEGTVSVLLERARYIAKMKTSSLRYTDIHTDIELWLHLCP